MKDPPTTRGVNGKIISANGGFRYQKRLWFFRFHNEKGGEPVMFLQMPSCVAVSPGAIPAIRGQSQVITFNASISSCEKANCWQQALQIFEEMMMELSPDVITMSALISCCEKAGQWQQAGGKA